MKFVKVKITIFVFIFTFLNLYGCSTSSSDSSPKLGKNITDLLKKEKLNINERSLREKSIEKEKPWSSPVLWEDLLKTKSHTSFTAKINDNLPPLNFKIVGKIIKNHRMRPDYEYFLPSCIEIYDSSKSKLIQTLNAKGKFNNDGDGWDNPNFDFVQIIDINFDGYLDLRLFDNAGATGNNWYATYIYNPNLHKFVFNKEISNLCDVAIDSSKKQISSSYYGGVGVGGTEYFKFVNNKLVSIKYEKNE